MWRAGNRGQDNSFLDRQGLAFLAVIPLMSPGSDLYWPLARLLANRRGGRGHGGASLPSRPRRAVSAPKQVVDQFYSGYGEQPNQGEGSKPGGRLFAGAISSGNAYLDSKPRASVMVACGAQVSQAHQDHQGDCSVVPCPENNLMEIRLEAFKKS